MRLLRVLSTVALVAVVTLAVAWRVAASDRQPLKPAASTAASARAPRLRALPALAQPSPQACFVAGGCSETPCAVPVNATFASPVGAAALRSVSVPARPLAGACPLGDRGQPGSRIGKSLEVGSPQPLQATPRP